MLEPVMVGTGKKSVDLLGRDLNKGIYAGINGDGLYKSTNRGIDWTQVLSIGSDVSFTGNEILYANEPDSWFVGTDEPALYKDGEKVLEPPAKIMDMYPHKNTVFITCDNDDLYRSTDGGDTWENIYTLSNLRSVWYDGGRVLIWGEDIARYSTDDGETWDPMNFMYHIFDAAGPYPFPILGKYIFLAEETSLLRMDKNDVPDQYYHTVWDTHMMESRVLKPYGIDVGPSGNILVSGEFGLYLGLELGEKWVRIGQYAGSNPVIGWDGYGYVGSGEYKPDVPLVRFPLPRLSQIPSPDYYNSQLFNNLDIRDTDNHFSNAYTNTSDHSVNSLCSMKGFSKGSISVDNGLDQDVTIQVQGDHNADFSGSVRDIGSSFTVGAGATAYETVTDPFPYLRLRASCATAPTSGTLDAYCYRW